MGISDDIKPKKVHHFVEHPVYEPRGKKEEKVEEIKPKKVEKPAEIDKSENMLEDFYNYENSDKRETLEDDFFSDQRAEEPLPMPKQENHTQKHRPMKRIIIIIIILALAILIIYQNLDVIKPYFTKTKNDTNSSTKESYYTGESVQSTDNSSSNASSGSSSTESQSSTDTQSESASTVATSTATVEVLNGSGVTGSADKVKSTLTSAGINVDKVANAKRFTYMQTYVYYKTGFETEANNIKNALSGRTVTVQQSDDIASEYNIVVIVGKK